MDGATNVSTDGNGIVQRLGRWIEGPPMQRFIMVLIILNAIILGLDTSPTVTAAAGEVLHFVDSVILGVFVMELVLRIAYRGPRFFTDAWNVFDFVVVAIALAPTSGGLSVLRALRILRVLRLITVVPQLRMVVRALLGSIPGLAVILGLQALLFYVAAVITTNLFGPAFDEWFGTIGRSLYSLFQIMTLESWSMGIVRPVMEKFPLAWAFFVPFILIATFTMLNLFIAVIVNAMQTLHEEEVKEASEDLGEAVHHAEAAMADTVREVAGAETAVLLAEIRKLQGTVERLESQLSDRGAQTQAAPAE